MRKFEYEISLRLWHPHIDPEIMTETIGITPKWFWKSGEPRKTPTNEPLEGRYKESYWSATLVKWNEASVQDSPLEKDLNVLAGQLSAHKALFSKILKDGGRAILWVNTHSEENYCVQLLPSQMAELNKTSLTLVIDIYPYPQNWESS